MISIIQIIFTINAYNVETIDITGWVLIGLMIIMVGINFTIIGTYSISMRIIKYKRDKKDKQRRRQIEAQVDPLFRSNYETDNVSNNDKIETSNHEKTGKRDRITFSHLRRF